MKVNFKIYDVTDQTTNNCKTISPNIARSNGVSHYKNMVAAIKLG